MPKEEWGVKRVCPTTGKRFYDLNRDPVISPYSGEVVPVTGNSKTRVLVADKADAESKTEDDAEDILIDDDDDLDDDDDDATVDDDTVLDDDDEDTVSLDEIGADVADTKDDE